MLIFSEIFYIYRFIQRIPELTPNPIFKFGVNIRQIRRNAEKAIHYIYTTNLLG
jgi:hypothetical protein